MNSLHWYDGRRDGCVYRGCRMRRSVTTLIILAVIGLVLLPAAINLATNAIVDVRW